MRHIQVHVDFSPFQQLKTSVKPHSYVFHFLSQIKTLAAGWFVFSRNVQNQCKQIEFNCMPRLLSKLVGALSMFATSGVGGRSSLCWWEQKKKTIVHPIDGYPQNHKKHGCYFHS